LLLLPLQLYALWLLLKAFRVYQEIDPNRRWKLWASILLNLPLMAFVLLLLSGRLRL
jgi:hypothetical protein